MAMTTCTIGAVGAGAPLSLRRRAPQTSTRGRRGARRSVAVASYDKDDKMEDAWGSMDPQVLSRLQESGMRVVRAKDAFFPPAGYRVLDVRPQFEWERAHIKGSVHIPLFVEDSSNDPLTLLKKQLTFGYGGFWEGVRLTKENPNFRQEVMALLKDPTRPTLVVCQKGLRSLNAAEMLSSDLNFKDVAWLQGGLDTVNSDDFPVIGSIPLRQAGKGGASLVLGMAGNKADKKVGEAVETPFFIKAAAVFLGIDLIYIAFNGL